MTLGHNITLGNLPFSALMPSTGGQGIPGLPFPMQSAALGLGLGGMLGGQRMPAVNRGPECLPRQNPQDTEAITENGTESDRFLKQTNNSSGRERHDGKYRESRKRMRSSSLVCDSDDDIMVLSNSPSSNEPNEQRENNAQSNIWENPPMPMGLSFPMPNPSLVNSSLYPPDPSSFMAAMGSQISFDVRNFLKYLFESYIVTFLFFSLALCPVL